jgi:magnesium-transporting ATPase (P-type)
MSDLPPDLPKNVPNGAAAVSPAFSSMHISNVKYLLLGVNAYLGFLILPNIIGLCKSLHQSERSDGWSHSVAARVILLILSCLVIVNGLVLLLAVFFRRKFARIAVAVAGSGTLFGQNIYTVLPSSETGSISPAHNTSKPIAFMWFARQFFFTSLCLLFSFVLILRTSSRECSRTVNYIDWSCNSYYEVGVFPMDTAFVLMLIPIVSSITNKERSLKVTVFLWIVVFSTLVICASLLNSFRSSILIINFLFLSGIVMGETIQLQSYLNTLSSSLRRQMEESQQLKDEKRMSQMKDVIGNVAHDLKTVSCSGILCSFFSDFSSFPLYSLYHHLCRE